MKKRACSVFKCCISKTPVYLYMNSFSCSLITELALCVHLCVCTFVRPCLRACMRVCWLVVSRPAHPSQLVSLPIGPRSLPAEIGHFLPPCPLASSSSSLQSSSSSGCSDGGFFFFFKRRASMSRLKLLLFPRLSPSVLK